MIGVDWTDAVQSTRTTGFWRSLQTYQYTSRAVEKQGRSGGCCGEGMAYVEALLLCAQGIQAFQLKTAERRSEVASQQRLPLSLT